MNTFHSLQVDGNVNEITWRLEGYTSVNVMPFEINSIRFYILAEPKKKNIWLIPAVKYSQLEF